MNSRPWKDDGTDLSEVERLAVLILSNSYARRVEAIVDGQIQGLLRGEAIIMNFVEPKQFGFVLAALEQARQIGIRDACAITVKHVDATYADKKANKALQAVHQEVQALRTDTTSYALAK